MLTNSPACNVQLHAFDILNLPLYLIPNCTTVVTSVDKTVFQRAFLMWVRISTYSLHCRCELLEVDNCEMSLSLAISVGLLCLLAISECGCSYELTDTWDASNLNISSQKMRSKEADFRSRSQETVRFHPNNVKATPLPAIKTLESEPATTEAHHANVGHGGSNRLNHDRQKASGLLGHWYSVSDGQCPAWFHQDSSCKSGCCCGPSLDNVVLCNNATLELQLLNGHCMTYDKQLGTVVGRCRYSCLYSLHRTHLPLYNASVEEVSEKICGPLNRQGRLCGRCKKGYRVSAYTYDLKCHECKAYNWAAYLMVAFVPLTVFFLIVVVFRISAASPLLNSFVLVCQTMSTPDQVRVVSVLFDLKFIPDTAHVYSIAKLLFTLNGIWNLDFFRTIVGPICLPISGAESMALDYVVAFYPLVLVVITYLLIELYARDVRLIVWLWRPFQFFLSRWSFRWDTTTSIVGAFATFLLLSYVKLLSISFDLLAPARMYLESGQLVGRWYLFYDATVEVFGPDHLPLAVLAISVLVVFIFLPLLLLFVYPMRCFQRILNFCGLNRHFLRVFMDIFQGDFKDGTNGTRDCRYVAALYLLGRILCFVVYGLVWSDYIWSVLAYSLLSMSIFIILVQPYKNPWYNRLDACFLIVLSVWFSLFASSELAGYITPKYVTVNAAVLVVLTTVPQLYLMGVVAYTLYARCSQYCPRKAETSPLLTDSLPHRLVQPHQYVVNFCV